LETRIISSKLTHNIRKKVLWPHITNENYSINVDDYKDTFHLGTFLNEKLISIGTFIKDNNPKFNCKLQYRLRAMATDENYRKIGAGKNLFFKGLEILKNNKIELLWCDARMIAIPFYKSMKMKSLPKTYNIPNIGEHKTMYIYLNSEK
tara:strand:- start:570 stop:1016 length:447 start_codon:yes stop_codon:yes gene_type:complete